MRDTASNQPLTVLDAVYNSLRLVNQSVSFFHEIHSLPFQSMSCNKILWESMLKALLKSK